MNQNEKTKAETIRIVSNLNSDNYSLEEKLKAIVAVSQMKNHGKVPKDALVDSLRFMVDLSTVMTSKLLEKEKK